MIIWLASYPRSGNTFFRLLLNQLFGLPTYTVYSVAHDADRLPDDTVTLMRLVGQSDLEYDLEFLRADAERYFVKTHEMPSGDDFPAIVIVRDGRDAAVSFAHFILKTERGIDRPSQALFDQTLEEVITGNRYGGWSANVSAWAQRGGRTALVRYEDLIDRPPHAASAALESIGLRMRMGESAVPSFDDLHSTVPWFFRRGTIGTWTDEMSPRLQQLFMDLHGEALLRMGYRDATSS